MRLLFVRLRSLGDSILMTPVLAAAKRLPETEVAVLVEEPFQEILQGNPHLDRLFVIPRRGNKLFSRLKIIHEVRTYKPDVAIDLHGGSTSALITALSGAPRRVGYQQSRNSRFYNVKVPDSHLVWNRNHVHTVEHQLSALKHLGFPVEPLPPLEVPVDPQAVGSVKRLLAEKSIGNGFVLIHSTAAFNTKQWETEKFAGLAHQLSRIGLNVVVTAGPGQDHLLEQIRMRVPPEVQFIEPLPLRNFAALTSLCSLYVGNDTGTTHMAAALGKKVVVIFGSSDFKIWYPWGVEHRLLRSDLPCIPCPGYYCLYYDRPRCIRSIEVEPVFQAVKSLL